MNTPEAIANGLGDYNVHVYKCYDHPLGVEDLAV